MMKRRTFLNATTVLGASFCSGLSASAQILQPSLPSAIAAHIDDLKGQVKENAADLEISNRYGLADNLFSVKRVIKESYDGDDYVFQYQNHLGNTIKLSKKKGKVITHIA